MPGFTTHYLFGQQSYQLMQPSSLKRNIQKNHTAFSLGLQGPDIFFYDILSLIFSRKNPGSIAHTADTGVFLRYLLEGPKIFPDKKEKEIASAYIFGYLGHYLLDTACHPYIYALSHYSSQPKGYMGKHIRLETDIDTALLWHYQRRRPSEFHQSETIRLTREQKHIISRLLYFAFSKTYPDLGPTRCRILQAICGMQVGTKLLYDPTGRKKPLIRRFEAIAPGYPILSPLVPSDTMIYHKDPCNASHIAWKNPWKASMRSTESFFDLFEKAQDDYIRILNDSARFLSRECTQKEKEQGIRRLLAALGNRCYHSGLFSAPYLP